MIINLKTEEQTMKNGILNVINSGVSISDVDIKQIFEPFYRIENSHNRKTGGSGLGLYIVKNILEYSKIILALGAVHIIIDGNKADIISGKDEIL